jgi:hypothetical protein
MTGFTASINRSAFERRNKPPVDSGSALAFHLFRSCRQCLEAHYWLEERGFTRPAAR